MKIYRVIEDTDLKEFESKVARYINNGWKLVGGVSGGDRFPNYCQAVIKESTEAEEAIQGF